MELRSERRSRKSRYDSSRSDDSDTNSDLEAIKNEGNRRARNRIRSPSETGRPFRNKHKPGNSSQSSSRSSSTSSTSCHLRRRKKQSRGRNYNGRKRSCSPERNQDKATRRTNSNDESCNSNMRKDVHRNLVRNKSNNSCDRRRNSDQSHSRTRKRRDKRSSSRDRRHSSDRSLSRTRKRGEKRSSSRDRRHSSDGSLSRTRKRGEKRSSSRGRKDSFNRSLSRIRSHKYERKCTRENRHGSDRSLSKTRRHRERRHHSHDWKRDNRNSLSREGKRNRDDNRFRDLSGDKENNKEDFHVRKRRRSYIRGRKWSSSSSGSRRKSRSYNREKNCSSSRTGREKKNLQNSSPRFFTLKPKSLRKQRGKYLSSDTPTQLDDSPRNKSKIQNTGLHSTGSDEETLMALLLKNMALSQADPQTIRRKTMSKSSPIQFEWQFQDEHGIWISYGKPNSSGDSSATTTSSDDIETHYLSNSTHTPLLVRSNQNNYLLNFQNMTQTNQTTSVLRPIRRISKQVPNIAPVNLRSFIVGGISNASILHEWQFLDEHGSWITYGKPNSAGNMPHATTTGSDDIEKHYSMDQINPAPLTINSKSNAQYILDFVGMTQTNQTTSVQRPIRRNLKQSTNIMPLNASPIYHLGGISNAHVPHDWQFLDEHGSWIMYGKPNSAGNMPHATTTCSDDIEKHYAKDQINPAPLTINSKSNAQYVLDFKKMTQTNQQTSVERKIRRMPRSSTSNVASPKGSSFIWSFKDEHDNWINYGDTSSSRNGTSDDIEKKFSQNPAASLEIFSGQNKYLLDFKAMTQTNIESKTVRAIRRQLVTASDLPSNWKPMKTADKGLLVVPLNNTDSEYTKQEAFVKKTLSTKYTITKLYRIQNENLWNDYVYKKKSLKARYPKIQFKEEYLFHGTDSKHLNAICEENFDFRLNGTNGVLYGMGTYFASSADFSARYSKGSPKVMFIVKVLVGRYTAGSASDRRPPKDKSGDAYDTTVDDASSPKIFVKYDNSEYYPEYYFEFT